MPQIYTLNDVPYIVGHSTPYA
ncbi:hypothetical protein RIR_e4422_jg21999.t1 [Rhizophagus irregularis DAOM 181602=DAOM 197198]|nr:hypothetical protein RIR_e4422_jg21999.t1 [Rhizophagus irregularis DAOM 181602=DAOM 197198]